MKMNYIALSLLVAGCCCPPPTGRSDSNRSESAAETAKAEPPAKPAEPEKAELPVDVGTNGPKLFKEYEANEVRADNKYKGKRILIFGTVEAIDKDFLGNVVLKLETGDMFATVSATLQDSEKSMAGDLSKGDGVKLICVGGTRVINMPTLRKCRFITAAESKLIDDGIKAERAEKAKERAAKRGSK